MFPLLYARIPITHFQYNRRVLRTFSNEERQQFLRFVWARSRLPPSSADFTQKFKVQCPVGDGARMNPDVYLPTAHTCFFSLILPKYTSEDVMKEKLLYAISNCTAMDADFRLAGSESAHWKFDDAELGEGHFIL